MHKHILSSAVLIGAVFIGAPGIAQDVPPNQQPPVTSQPPPTSPIPDPNRPTNPLPGQTSPTNPTQMPQQTQPPVTEGTASVKVSDTVYGSDGNPVGTIEAVEGSNVVLSTGTVKVRIPVSKIAQGPKGATIALTKAEVEAQAQKSPTPPQ